MNYPRYFTRIGGFTSDALYVRYDSVGADGVIVTATGERTSNHGPWPMSRCELMVEIGQGRELTAEEARAMAPHGVKGPDHG